MRITTYEFLCGQSIIRIRIILASSCVSLRLPPNKAPFLMLRINTCDLLRINLYVINQSYEFVFHLTSLLQPQNRKVRTFGKWCWWRSPYKAPLLMLRNDTCDHIRICMWTINHTNLYYVTPGSSSPHKAWAGSSSPRKASVNYLSPWCKPITQLWLSEDFWLWDGFLLSETSRRNLLIFFHRDEITSHIYTCSLRDLVHTLALQGLEEPKSLSLSD